MKITQARVSESVKFFAERFHRRYGLGLYVDSKVPCVFFGCYHWRGDAERIMAHKSIAVIVWCGSDIMKIASSGAEPVLRAPHVRHVAIGGFVARDLDQLHLPFVRLPIAPVDLDLYYSRDIPLGRNVYTYSSHSNPEFYGLSTLQEVQRTLLPEGIKFHVGYATEPNFPAAWLPRLFAETAVGLRLTKHDGLPATALELGLMGRKCIHNDPDMPNVIPWRDDKDVCDSIRAECAKAGSFQPRVADATRAFLNLPPNWLTTEFYDDPASQSR